MKIDELWQALEADLKNNAVSDGYLTRRIIPEGKCDLKLAIEKPSGARMLLLRVQRDSLPGNLTFPESSGFEVRKGILPGDGETCVTLQLILKNERFQDIFTTLLEDVSAVIAFIPVERDAIDAMNSRLRRWQLFLEQYSPEGLSEESQHGLYGELWVLRQIVVSQLGISSVQYWTGPSRAAQDFQFPGYAIEVKTTVNQYPQKLFISNKNQLDESMAGELILLHLSVEARSGIGETLPEIVNNLRSSFSNNPDFERLLFEAGYLDIHAQKYAQPGYSNQTTTFYKVESSFPRLTPSTLPDGILEVEYAIQLSKCRDFTLAESEVLNRIRSSGTGDVANG